VIKIFCVSWILLSIFYYFRSSATRFTADQRIFHAFFAATFIGGGALIWTLIENVLGTDLLASFSGRAAQSEDMICMKCWYVQTYSPNLICAKCGCGCEDAKYWTWSDGDGSTDGETKRV